MHREMADNDESEEQKGWEKREDNSFFMHHCCVVVVFAMSFARPSESNDFCFVREKVH